MRRNSIICFTLLGLLAIAFSCEDRFAPLIDARYNEVLVVDGRITSGSGPYTVRLSWSSMLDSPLQKPAEGFGVKVADDLGNTLQFTESEPGVYHSATDGFSGIPGHNYRLEIQSPGGKTYFSEYEKLPTPVAIDSVYYEVEYSVIDDYPFDLPGYRFYLDAQPAPDDSTYFMWQLNETYRYESDLKIYFSYYDRILHEVQNKDTLKVCWKSNLVTGFYLMSTENLQVPEIMHFPLHYVSTDNRKLSVRYSLYVSQFTLSETAYRYWQSTIEQNTETGELFTKQPYQVRGNVYNPDDSEESVFGYFYAAGMDTRRIFVNRPETPVRMYYSKCFITKNDKEMYGWMFLGPPPSADNPLYVTEDAQGDRALTGQACVNCLLKGGTTQKPDFWIDQ